MAGLVCLVREIIMAVEPALKRSARIKMIIFSSFIPYIKKSSNAKTGSVLFLHTRATWYHPADIRHMILLDGHRNSPQDLFEQESERYG